MEFVQNNILLIAVAVVSGGMLLWPMLRSGAGGARVDTLVATQLINREDALVLDVREPADYASGHILGAKNVPLAQLQSRAAEFSKHRNKPVIAYCENGNRSGGAVGILKAQGFANVHNLSGGFSAWRQAGLPVQK
jgi:rhodanese-related sulfurtransferase